MSELTDLMKLIKGNASIGNDTDSNIWERVIELLEGKNDAETWDNLRNMIFIHIE